MEVCFSTNASINLINENITYLSKDSNAGAFIIAELSAYHIEFASCFS